MTTYDSIFLGAGISGLVAGIRRASRFEIAIERAGKTETLHGSTLIVAVPADAAAKLLQSIAPEVTALVSEIPYNAIASVPLAYKTEQVSRPLDGFGFLSPRGAGLRTRSGSIFEMKMNAIHISCWLLLALASVVAVVNAEQRHEYRILIHGGGTGKVFGLVRDWTLGCVALENEDIKELFETIPVKTPVKIVP